MLAEHAFRRISHTSEERRATAPFQTGPPNIRHARVACRQVDSSILPLECARRNEQHRTTTTSYSPA
ncbi:hypothetical protein [Burkholderia pseudomallei]|uniref:hypothetical protein n=1 Tax=Burkholderia pseudomallei TaxID=28450 RepID=UPI00016AFBED|nr:hypothetical protein [Burkholderia pseudomallei]MDV2083787.1 hypothetical protein [Burkholderia pseudomallei]MDV2165144.1 hypothetical protein [Burkholderia pseudomallei]MDV2238604.1 hypothetical protein [Burkholderia pseudomallei]PPF07048.1 hypothetical protein B9D88_011905 [Burkholderia pseudomallei]